MSSSPAIVADHLSKTYRLFKRPQDRLKQSIFGSRRKYYQEVHALRDVSFVIKQGETVGIVGCNGSGKSTLLQTICGTVTPTSGICTAHGRISALLELGAGFNPEFTGKENVFLNGAILGMSKAEIQEKYSAIEAFANIGAMIDQPVKTYSSGMYVRLAFAVAIASDPDILVVDEALAVGDEAFQRKCFSRIRAIQERGGTILFVSHSAHTIIEVCDRAILMDKGELLYSGSPKSVIAQYHKLIYAPETKVAQVRADILSLPNDAPAEAEKLSSTSPVHALLDGESYNPELVPESTLVYESHGARISRPEITTLSGERVNVLRRRQRYQCVYEVTFQETAYAVRCGILLKTRSGIELGGASTSSLNETIDKVKAGTTLQITFTFTCLLLPGTYFINCGCSGDIKGERIFLHRIVDAAMFQIMPDASVPVNGIVDFLIDSDVKTKASPLSGKLI